MREGLRQPVTFNRESLRLTIGRVSTEVPDPTSGNEAMLRAYLALVANVRGTPIGSGVEIRHDDIIVLAEILDLADSDLEQHLADLLGVSAEDAAEVHRRLRWHKSLIAAAGLTVGGLTYFGATNLASADALPPAPPIVTASVPDGSTTTTTVIVNVPDLPPPPSSLPLPAPSDDVEIGDALVIERGQPPADPDVQIGDSVTYER